MESTQNICESCKVNPIEVEEQSDVGQPYRLCHQCHDRLINKALRPSEFFNLAAIHGQSGFLHDDFYDYETGEATQPDIEVTEVESHPFPNLKEIKGSLEKLVDYACVQFFTSIEVIELLKAHDKQSLLSYLESKVCYNRAINYKAYEIAAKVLGSYAANWIRQQWSTRAEDELLIFAEALAKCLPFAEGFTAVTKEVESSNNRLFAENSEALIYFHSPLTLQWMERVKARIINVSSQWGLLAASSQFDWKTAEDWLEKGRPLSLIALDALNYCTARTDNKVIAYWQLESPDYIPIELYNSAKPEVIARSITQYVQKDNTPRTRNTLKQIIDNLFETIQSKSTNR